jgi:aconitase B
VLNYTPDVTAAPSGAAFPGVGSPWADLSAMGTSHVRMPNPVLVAAKGTEARLAAFRQIPAMTTKQLAATATGLPTAIQNRKHTVYKTRVNAGGDGASGPHPEREPA